MMQTTNKNSVQRRHHATILPATRITHAFERAQNEERGILIPYFMCGYPSAAQSIELVLAAATGGADIIELGMPFSDPLADGATIQHAGHVALERGMTVNGCLEVARRVASQCAVPLLFMGYYNPILAYGLERFCQEAAASGVCGYTKDHNLPLVVGFGLSTPEHIAEVTNYVEGAVVGSALVNLIDQHPESQQVEAVKKYIESLRKR